MRLIVLDTDWIACAGWHALLASQPWVARCAETTSAEDCLAKASVENPHVVLVARALVCTGRVDLCRELHREHSDARVVVVWDTDAPAVRAVGASGLVHRDWPLDRILSVIHHVALGSCRKSGVEAGFATRAHLSRRELAVLELVATGASNPEIALALHLSRHTVKEYTQAVFRKLGVRNRVEAATAATRLGLVH